VSLTGYIATHLTNYYCMQTLRIAQILTLFYLTINSISAQNLVTYAGNSGNERFHAIVQLSNGTFLVGGSATDLNWIPAGVTKTPLSISGITSTSTGKFAFIIQFSSDFSKMLSVIHFPQGTVRDVFKIKTSNIVGQATGDIFISGNRDVSSYATDGYYIAKLNNNFVKGIPTALSWTHEVVCPPRKAAGYAGESQYKTLQPWDVGSDGKVIFGRGAEYDTEWAEIRRLNASGQPEVVENWHAHWAVSTEWDGTPASTYPNKTTAPLTYSAIVLKAGRKGSLRSYTQAQYDALMNDGNGNMTRKGSFPDDYYYSGPCAFSGTCAGTKGYTGYKPSDKPTQRLGAIVIDRKTNHFYFGYSTQSVLPDGLPDFEPAIVAMDNTGKLKWWNRLYKETAANSTPDQYVDNLAIDYKNNQLVVVARCHGNNTDNLWHGNKITANPTANGFQNQFTGTNGNIHISWLGKFTLNEGTVRHSTYVAEYIEGTTSYGAALTNPNMRSWPDFNKGWANVNTTYIYDVHVSTEGLVSIIGKGRRTMTTANAYQSMPLPANFATEKGTWGHFVRTYTADLSRPLYSSLLTGKWDMTTGAGGDNLEIDNLIKIDAGLVAVGYHKVDTGSVAMGAHMPIANVPNWGTSTPTKEQAVLARLTADSIKTKENTVVSDIKTLDYQGVVKIYPNPTSQFLNVDITNAEVGRADIIDIMGRVLHTEGVTQNNFTLSTQSLEKGFYFLQLKDKKGEILTVLKFLKQ
jgi:hypothetical protein